MIVLPVPMRVRNLPATNDSDSCATYGYTCSNDDNATDSVTGAKDGDVQANDETHPCWYASETNANDGDTCTGASNGNHDVSKCNNYTNDSDVNVSYQLCWKRKSSAFFLTT